MSDVGWLSLDAGDNDPVRFWRHAVAALIGRGQASPSAAPLLGPPAPASFEAVATAVVNELAAEDGGALLVLDDYHLIEAQPVHAPLQFLIEHQPPGLHVVLASRADPQLRLARLRARGQLAELRRELMFTVDEAAALLARGGRVGAARRRGGTACGPNRGVGHWPTTGSTVAAPPAGRRRLRQVVLGQPPPRPGLPDRGGARTAAGVDARVPVRDVSAGPAVGRCATRSPDEPMANRC